MRTRLSTEQFISKAIYIHGSKYEYSKSKFTGLKKKIEIICKKHGSFFQKASNHIYNNGGCPTCGIEKRSKSRTLTKEQFINRAMRIHGDIYDYNKVIYNGSCKKVEIICQTHGAFFQRPNNHLNAKNGCPSCATSQTAKNNRHTKEHFINNANMVHNNIYDYSKVEYVNSGTPVEIICQTHGVFFQRPDKHLHHNQCPTCSYSISNGERNIIKYLTTHNIIYTHDKSFDDLRGLETNKKLRYDFWLPFFNTLIEYDGEQHYRPINIRGLLSADEAVYVHNRTAKYDKMKNVYAIKKGYNLFRIPYTELDNINSILSNEHKTNFNNTFSPYFVRALAN